MNVRAVRSCIGLVFFAGVFVTGCSNNSPSEPSVTVGPPSPQQPANDSQIAFGSQPVTLTVQNASSSSSTTYTFEVSTDSAFTAKLQVKDGVPQGTSGQTSVKLDALAGGKDYYWHARATAGGTTSSFGSTARFTIGAGVTIDAPVPIGPLSGARTNPRPAFRVTNSTRQGAGGTLTYRFDIGADAGFSSIVMTATTSEGINETGFIPTTDLPTGISLFWRATAIDSPSGVSSVPSATQSFTAAPFSQAERIASQLGVVLWPGIQPPGTVGHATMGENWQVQTLHHIPTNTFFQSPTLEMLRMFDLLDRGFEPDPAISWMLANGYPTVAFWYPPPEKAVIGYEFVYLAARNKVYINGTWDLVLKVE